VFCVYLFIDGIESRSRFGSGAIDLFDAWFFFLVVGLHIALDTYFF
jgi:hypothetical protein